MRRSNDFVRYITYDLGSVIPSDPVVDLGAQELYANIRKQTNGKFNYTVHDIKNYVLAIGEMLKLYGYMTKLYGLLNRKDENDPELTKAIEDHYGVSLSNLPNMRLIINRLGVILNTFNINTDMTYLRRCL